MNPVPKPRPRKREAVKVYPDGREVCSDSPAGKAEYARRLRAMVDRQKGLCPFGGILANDFTFDHERTRGHGGGYRDDRIEVDGHWQNAAVHIYCNALKGSRRYAWVDGKYQPVERER